MSNTITTRARALHRKARALHRQADALVLEGKCWTASKVRTAALRYAALATDLEREPDDFAFDDGDLDSATARTVQLRTWD